MTSGLANLIGTLRGASASTCTCSHYIRSKSTCSHSCTNPASHLSLCSQGEHTSVTKQAHVLHVTYMFWF
ncbi:hypothetical protein PF008_g31098 [Phytophthora fragariae]|uniref:Uncharacterized protein n=1 Tax=Phytophthora fragariae TaxID=53985 RepID=A0A6G0Q3M0_9STRA|nr:hypothetical protein PF008_g31098 [Phytophthora fragariae]